MNTNLIKQLIERKLIKFNTEIEANIELPTIGSLVKLPQKDFFHIVGAKLKNNEYIFNVVRKFDAKPHKIHQNNILNIEGMDIKRFANVYGLKYDGSKKVVKLDPITGMELRRGRKTNKTKELMRVLKEKENA